MDTELKRGSRERGKSLGQLIAAYESALAGLSTIIVSKRGAVLIQPAPVVAPQEIKIAVDEFNAEAFKKFRERTLDEDHSTIR
jgi:hypothetical protein